MGKVNRTSETHSQKAHLKRMGRDEMNLAEFPLATLADRVPPGCKTLVFEDDTWDKGQKRHVHRRLTISASDKYGLPTALDDEVILGLVQLSKADNFASRQVQFSRYQLIHLLGWREEGKSYKRLDESLRRWLGVTLYYDSAWWDKSRKRWVDAHFHLLDNLTLYQRSKPCDQPVQDNGGKPLSSFIWNEVIFRSFQAGNLRGIDLKFYRTLKSAVAKRIYRFLDKHFYFAHKQRYNLAQFAKEHIGLSRKYDTAQLKRRLMAGVRELENAGYLRPLSVKERFIRVRRGEWDVVFIREAKPAAEEKASHQPVGLESQLVERGVTSSVATSLVREFSSEAIKAKIQVFDQLIFRRDSRVSKNPAGYLVQSIRNDYAPPADLQVRPRVSVAASTASCKAETPKYTQRRDKKDDLEQQRIKKHLAGLSTEERSELEIEALNSSPSLLVKRFQEAVASGSKALVREYRRCMLERQLRMIFRAMDEQARPKQKKKKRTRA